MKSLLFLITEYVTNWRTALSRDSIKRIKSDIFIYLRWAFSGKPVPPPHLIKQIAIKQYSRKYRISVLVETGTYLGEMIEAVKSEFRKVYSIELGEILYRDAVKKFAEDKNVVILRGDSAKTITDILSEINEKCVFWLDGHYSSGNTAKGDKHTPIQDELEHILNHHVKGHILLIDDARLFCGENDYPALDTLMKLVIEKNPDCQMYVKDDIIRFI